MKLSPKPHAISKGRHAAVVKAVNRYLFCADPRMARRAVKELLREFVISKIWSKQVPTCHKKTLLYECEQLLKLLRALRKCQS